MLQPEAPTLDAPPAGRLAGLLTLGLLVGTINGLSRVALPLFAASLGAQAWQVGVVGGLGYAGLLLLALPLGAWIDHHGSRRLFLGGVVGAAAIYLVLPLVHEPAAVVAATALLGLALPFRTVPTHTEFLALVPRLSAAKAGWNRAANTLGMFFFGPALSAAVVAAFGFPFAFRLVAATLLVAGLVGRQVLEGRHPGTPAQASSLAARMRDQVALLAHHAELRWTMAIDFLTQIAVAYFVVFAIVLAVRHFGMSLQAAAGLITLQGTTYVLCSFAGGGLLMRRREATRYLLAFVLLAAFGALYGFGGTPLLLWPGAALFGVGVAVQGLTSVTRFAALMQTYGRGRVAGLTSLAGPAGGVIGAMLGGAASQRWGPEAGFCAIAVAFGVLCLWQARRAAASGLAPPTGDRA